MILEHGLLGLAEVSLAEAAEVQGIVLAGGADVIAEQVVVSNHMTLIDMIPEPTNVRDEFTVVIDQGVVDGNDASGMVTCIGGGSRDMIRSGNHMAMTPRDGNVYRHRVAEEPSERY